MININLLPPELKAGIKQTKVNSFSLSLLFRMLFLAGFIIILVFSLQYYLRAMEKEAIKSAASSQQAVDDYKNLENDAKKLAARLNAIKSISKNTNKWSSTLEELQRTIPEGVYLTTFKIDVLMKSTRGQLSGKARNPKDVAALRESLDASKKFEFVDIDQSQSQTDPTTKQTNQVFTISFSLSPEALK